MTRERGVGEDRPENASTARPGARGTGEAVIFRDDRIVAERADFPEEHTFPLPDARHGEDDHSHLGRLAERIDAEIAAGGTRLRIPREAACWIDRHPSLADYLVSRFPVVEANRETGITFALEPVSVFDYSLETVGWQPVGDDHRRFVAPRRLSDPRISLLPNAPTQGNLRGQLGFACQGPTTLLLTFRFSRADRPNASRRQVVLSLARPGFIWHDLSFVDVAYDVGGEIRIDFDLKVNGKRSLEAIDIEIVEEDNWRMHPGFDGGRSFMLPARAPKGSSFDLRNAALWQTDDVRRGPGHGHVRSPAPPPFRRTDDQRRDAVIFSSWIPEGALPLGDYFIEVMRRWHSDSKIFVGINHGSAPAWRERLEGSGLDLVIRHAPPEIGIDADPAGFVAALDAFRQTTEEFALVWFGHTKGAGNLDNRWYSTGRWTIERLFWSRRAEIDDHFANPVIGLYAPHYLMMLQDHLAQTDALQRVYRATCAPLGVMAVSTHFVMRSESVSDFCQRVDRRFFREGPTVFGGDRYFFEMAMPNVPLMQGYEPYIEPGLGGTSGAPVVDGISSVINDWRQNNAVTAIELEKWRKRPTRFRTRHREYTRHD